MNLIVVLLSLLWSDCHGFYQFQAYIPNGLNVKDPCDHTQIWKGVGHIGALGSGPRNAFGEDFKASGYVSTIKGCSKNYLIQNINVMLLLPYLE